MAPKSVLFVDDDDILLEVMAAQLAELDLQVVRAGNGEEGRELAGRDSFDLAIIDLSMPKLDGFGLIRHIRQHPKSVDLPVIVLTSSNDRRSIEKAYELGASSFVTKPINWPQFAHHVLFVLRAGETERALRAAEAEAIVASRMKNGLFHILSHELKTPLTALVGLTEVLQASLHDRLQPMEVENFGHVMEAARRLSGIVSDTLMFSKALSGLRNLDLSSCLVSDLLEDSVIGLRARAAERQVTLRVQPALADATIRCDERLIRQALSKLIDNAIKFSPAGASVDVGAHEKDDGSMLLTVQDQGPGLSQARLRDCLQPLVQDDMSYSRAADGLGLGLPIAKAVAEAHGGELIVSTSPGKGLVAGILLPAQVAAEAA